MIEILKQQVAARVDILVIQGNEDATVQNGPGRGAPKKEYRLSVWIRRCGIFLMTFMWEPITGRQGR